VRCRLGVVLCGLFAAVFLAGCAPSASGSADASPGGCAAYAYHAIERHVRVTATPAACAGLTADQVNAAVGTAIRESEGTGDKAERRKRAAAAAPWVSALLTAPVPAGQPSAVSGGEPGAGGSGLSGPLGGVSEFAVALAALLAWLVTAASGSWLLLRWLRAGGSLRTRGGTAAPPAAMAGHAVCGAAGFVVWTLFTITGWAGLAWACTVLLLPVAGLGMGVLILGLPSPQRGKGNGLGVSGERSGERGVGDGDRARARAAAVTAGATLIAAPAGTASGGRPRVPALVIASHGLFAAASLLLVIMATIGAR